MKSTTVIFADELISIVDQDLDASEELDQLRKAVYAYRYATAPQPTKQAQRRMQNSARWMYLAGQHDPDLLTRNLVELWGIDEATARQHAETAARHAAQAEGAALSHPIPYTAAQQRRLDLSPCLRVVQRLDDGDLLVLDLDPVKSELFWGNHYGPYIMTDLGFIQDVNYHHHYHHGMTDVPFEY